MITWYWYGLSVLYAVIGLLGAILIEDEFYVYTLSAAALLGVPLLTLGALLIGYRSRLWTNSLTIRTFIIGCILTGFGPGVLTALNAATSNGVISKQRIHYGAIAFLDEKKEGGFGILFKYRF